MKPTAQSLRVDGMGRVDRNRPLTFTFNDTPIHGYAGDTVASALLANGIHLVGRSFKYHRPRGLMSHGSEEPNALLRVDRGAGREEPNNRATVIEARDGLRVFSQNHWPSLNRDALEINDLLSPLLSAGFYYKTFMWPAKFWKKLYEPLIRRASGLGEAPGIADLDRYQQRFAHCEVLVVGAGPSGLAAALAASQNPQTRVFLVDESTEMGGSLLHDAQAEIDGQSALDWLAASLATLTSRKNVTVLPRTTAFAYYNHNMIGLAERVSDHLAMPQHLPRERLWQLRAGRVILACGAHERPLVFPGNDRPGILLAESLRAYLNRYGVLAGRRLVIATCGGAPYQLALEARRAGASVTLCDRRRRDECGPEIGFAEATGCEIFTASGIVATRGHGRIRAVQIAPIDGAPSGPPKWLECDAVGMHGGFTPNVQLFSQSRGKLRFVPEIDAFVPGDAVQANQSAGACRGVYDLAACLLDGWQAGGGTHRTFHASQQPSGFLAGGPWADSAGQKAFIDFQNDVTAKDIGLAVDEGFQAIEHVKRYTTTGMATDQGKTSNMNALGLVAQKLRQTVAQTGTTTFRLPTTPVSFGAFAGAHHGAMFDPIRRTPMHGEAEAAGAVFEDVGAWKRALYFRREGETMALAVAREARNVRENVGVFDASTLGKIEINGPDAGAFLNRIYFNDVLKLAVGRARYGLMLREDGHIFDDGIVARLDTNRYHITTTTGGAARVHAHLEDYLQTQWPELQAYATPVTEQWAVISVQGPRAREVLAPLITGMDISRSAMPHMSVRVGACCGVPCRLFRVSFTGELGFEVNVPADYGPMVWQAILDSGRGIAPYGTQAMHVLRAEKGYIIVGQETDGTVSPADVGLGAMTPRAKPDYVGQRGLLRAQMTRPGRKQMVGLLSLEPSQVLDEGAQIVRHTRGDLPMASLGHVTSAYASPNCRCAIALAMVEDGATRHGETVYVTKPNGWSKAQICPPIFVDAQGSRVHG